MQRYKIIFFFLMISFIVNAQTDWLRWEGKKTSYELSTTSKRDYSIDDSSFGMIFLSLSRNAYYFLISDLDGDNCPFYPSCSRFFIEAVKETNIVTGTFLFADRFTRDMNPFKRNNYYSLDQSGKYFDPPYNYTLNLQKIKL